MIAVNRDYDDGQSVINFFDYVYASLDKEIFIILFQSYWLIMDWNFQILKPLNLIKMETKEGMFLLSYINHIWKKAYEISNELIRKIISKSNPLKSYNQKDNNLKMNHINSYIHPKPIDKTPLSVFDILFSK